MESVQYQCCFCGERIAKVSPDPCGLAITASLILPIEKQVTQGFYCHIKCFEKKLHSLAHLCVRDIMEDD